MKTFTKVHQTLNCFFKSVVFFGLATVLVFGANNPPGVGDPPPCDSCGGCEIDNVAEDGEADDGAMTGGSDFLAGGGSDVKADLGKAAPLSPARIGSISFSIPFGKSVFPALNGGSLKVRKSKPTPDLYDPSVLFYTGVSGKWLWLDETTDGSRTLSFLDRNGEFIRYTFSANSTIGLPTGKDSINLTRAYLLDANGSVIANNNSNVAAYVELRFYDSSRQRYSLTTNQIVGIGTSVGQYINLADVPDAARLDVVRNETTLRQLKSAAGLADILPLGNENGFVVRLYTTAQVGVKTNGLYPLTGSPYRTFTFENPDVGSPNPLRLKITDVWGAKTREYMYSYQEALDDWLLVKGNGASQESKQLISPSDANPKIYKRVLTDASGAVVSTVQTSVLKAPWGGSVYTSKTVDPDGLNYTTNYEYNLNEGAVGYGKLSKQTNPDGSWSRYIYDSKNRQSKIITPWLDSPANSDEGAARVVESQYTSHDAADVAADNDARPRTVIERVTGIEVRRSYYVYGINSNGERYEIEERAASPSAVYGASGNLRTTRTYYANNAGIASAGKLKTIQRPNNTLTTYHYTLNVTGQTVNLLTTVTQGTVASPAGIAYKTQRSVTTQDACGHAVQAETQVYTGGAYSTLNIFQNVYSADDFLIQSSKDGRITYDATYSGGLLVSTTDETGIVKNYTYDSLDRVATETKIGTATQPDIVTTYTRTLGGLDCGCDANLVVTISAGNLALTSSTKKDQLGRITETIDNAGMTTTYAYTNGGRTTTILKPNTATEIRDRYIDGQGKSTTGTGVIAQYNTRGVNTDGTQWSKTNLVSANGARWTKSTSDFLGRTMKQEVPGFGHGTIILSTNVYNSLNQLATQTTETVVGSAGILPASGTKTTTYIYDALNVPVSTTTVYAGQTTSLVTNINNQLFTQTSGAWFSQTKQQVQYTDESGVQQTITTGISRQQLNNFTSGIIAYSEKYAPPFTSGISVNKTTQTTTLSRSTMTVISLTALPTSIQPSIQTTIAGLLVSSVSPSHGGTTLYQYDALRRQTGQKQPRHCNYSNTTYNANGQVISVTDANGGTTTYTYYANGIVGAGQLFSETNALGNNTYHAYNLRGQETQTWGSAMYPVVQDYDSYGQTNLLKTYRDTSTNFNGTTFSNPATADTTRWIYDDVTGLLLQKLYADNKGASYTYYADGLLNARTWARKDVSGKPLTTHYRYNVQGLTTNVDYGDATPSVAYTYNTLGQKISITDGSGVRTFAYDLLSQVLTQEKFSGTVNGILNYAYDIYLRPVGYVLLDSTIPTNAITAAAYNYDANGSVSHVHGDTIPVSLATGVSTSALVPSTFTYTRVPNSNLISTVTSPAHIVANTYETNRDVLTTKQNKVAVGTAANTVISQYDYTVNAIGQRTARTQSGTAFASTNTDTFTYNTRGEVTSSVNPVLPTNDRRYSYDAIGNRLTAREGANAAPISSVTYTSNLLNQYTQINTSVPTPPTVATPTYDDDGNMLADGTGKTYSWDAENRLIQVVLSLKESIHYAYDSQGRRIERRHVSANNTQTTSYLYDSWNVVYEKTKSSDNFRTDKTYLWGCDVSNTFQGAGGIGGLLLSQVANGNAPRLYHHTYDGNGNVSELLAVDGNSAAHYEYDPFGKENVSVDYLLTTNTYRFSTKSLDGVSKMNYFGFRFYSGVVGNWLNRDPSSERDKENIYRFLSNNALTASDYLGLYLMSPCPSCGRFHPGIACASYRSMRCASALATVRDYIDELKKSKNWMDDYSIELFEHFLRNTREPFNASETQMGQIMDSAEFRTGLAEVLKRQERDICRGREKGEHFSEEISGRFRVQYGLSNKPLWRAIGGGTIEYTMVAEGRCQCSFEACGSYRLVDWYSFAPGGIRTLRSAYDAFRTLQLECGYRVFLSTGSGELCSFNGRIVGMK